MESVSGSHPPENSPPAEKESPPDVSPDRESARGTRSVSVIVPTYNESGNIKRVIERCEEAMAGIEYELIVVDDDSPDGTWRVAKQVGADLDRVSVIRRQNERGLGTAILRGFGRATKDFYAVLDADLQHPPELIPELLNHATEYVDIVIGSRYRKGGYVENWPLIRHIVSHGAIGLTKLCIEDARGLDDPLSGFFLLRHSVVDTESLEPRGYKILLEILVKCEYSHVIEVPYEFHERQNGSSKLTIDSCRQFLAHLATLRSRQ